MNHQQRKTFLRLQAFLLIAGLVLISLPAVGASVTPSSLTCEYLDNPSVIDVLHPRLGWINENPGKIRGAGQSAFQIRVASSKESLVRPDLWDSGKTLSEQHTRIAYAGKELVSRQECWWQVRTWDENDEPSDWSEPSYWRMGLLDTDDWKASWIGAPWQGEEAIARPGFSDTIADFGPPAPYFRKSFHISRPVEKAVVFVTGLGYFELYANGERIGDDYLVPNQTNYGRRPELNDAYINVQDNFTKYKVMYLAYDIELSQGENVLGGLVGNGFYNPAKFWTEGYGTPRFLAQLHITYTDGSEEIITTDESWKVSRSPILMNMVYYGEIYDARLESEGWDAAGYDDSSWENATLRTPPDGELVAHSARADGITERISPVAVTRLGEGHYAVDFGVEISGWVRLNNVNGPAGSAIDISFNGNLYSGDNRYICSGSASTYAPRFNWFVFSGVEIRNWPGDLQASDLTAEAINTRIEEAAVFESSNKLFNEINTIWRRSQTDNMHGGIASDCPHRERSGYTGDGQVAAATVMHNYDARNFYQKWISDIRDAQDRDTGYVPNGAPWQPGCGGGVAWGAAICLMPWEFYLHYGAADMLEDNYESMKGYIRYMDSWVDEEGIMFSQRRNGSGEILKWYNLGEWVSPGEPVPDALVHTFYYWMCADITARTAAILGHTGESEDFAALAIKTKNAFHKRFFNEDKKSYGNGGGDIFALYMGVPDVVYSSVRSAVIDNIRLNDGHLDTGIFGTRYFFEVLAMNGLNDLAFEAMNKRTEPGFGRWIELGSTTTREHWDESGSFNHPMFGGGLVWLYRHLAGMQFDEEAPGFRHIIFRPQPPEGMEFTRYSLETSYGQAGISWKQETDRFTMDLLIPPGCSATAYVPSRENSEILEGGSPAETATGAVFTGHQDGYAIFELSSGSYSFSVLN